MPRYMSLFTLRTAVLTYLLVLRTHATVIGLYMQKWINHNQLISTFL